MFYAISELSTAGMSCSNKNSLFSYKNAVIIYCWRNQSGQSIRVHSTSIISSTTAAQYEHSGMDRNQNSFLVSALVLLSSLSLLLRFCGFEFVVSVFVLVVVSKLFWLLGFSLLIPVLVKISKNPKISLNIHF